MMIPFLNLFLHLLDGMTYLDRNADNFFLQPVVIKILTYAEIKKQDQELKLCVPIQPDCLWDLEPSS